MLGDTNSVKLASSYSASKIGYPPIWPCRDNDEWPVDGIRLLFIIPDWPFWMESNIDELVGGFNPSEKYRSQLGWSFPIYGKIKTCSKPPTSECFENTIHFHPLTIFAIQGHQRLLICLPTQPASPPRDPKQKFCLHQKQDAPIL